MNNLDTEHRKQIKKNIEACIEWECENCSYAEQTSCRENLLHDALACINSQEEKINKLTEEKNG